MKMDRIYTELELLEIGERIAHNPTRCGFEIGDPPRPVTNVEMMASCMYHRSLIERAANDGTCECVEGPFVGGRCREATGIRCPLWSQAVGIRKRMERDER